MQNFNFQETVSELCQAKVLMVLVKHLLSTKNEQASVYNIFAGTIVNSFSGNPVLFINFETIFPVDTMMYYQHTQNQI